MVEVSESILAVIGLGIPIALGLVYFLVSRKDKKAVDNRSFDLDLGSEERDKVELARKVKKELADEAEKVESIRKDIAKFVKEEMHEFIEQKVKEQKIERDHVIETFEQKIEAKFQLSSQETTSKFQASDIVMTNLMTKMVEIAKVQADAIIKINDSIDALKRLLYELTGKISRAERDINNKVSKTDNQ